MSSDKNPYHSPVAESDMADYDSKSAVSRLGMASLVLSLVPLLIVVGCFAAFSLGVPPLTRFVAMSLLITFGVTATLALALGVSSFLNSIRVSAILGVAFGLLDMALLSLYYWGYFLYHTFARR